MFLRLLQWQRRHHFPVVWTQIIQKINNIEICAIFKHRKNEWIFIQSRHRAARAAKNIYSKVHIIWIRKGTCLWCNSTVTQSTLYVARKVHHVQSTVSSKYTLNKAHFVQSTCFVKEAHPFPTSTKFYRYKLLQSYFTWSQGSKPFLDNQRLIICSAPLARQWVGWRYSMRQLFWIHSMHRWALCCAATIQPQYV